MHGVEFVFSENWEDYEGDKEQVQKLNIQKVLDWIAPRYLAGYSFFRVWSDETHDYTPHIIIKCDWEQADSAERLFSSRNKTVSVQRYEVCKHENCHKPTMAHGKDVLLFENDVEAESGYEIHDYCLVHAKKRESRQIARTIETSVVVPGQTWTKIFSFQIDKQFWAQRVTLVDEGDYEYGELIASYPTPWVGPYIKRELAIQATRDYEE